MISILKSFLIFFSMTAESFHIQIKSLLITELKISYLINLILVLPYLKNLPINLIKILTLVIFLLFTHLILVNLFNENFYFYFMSGFAQILGISFMFFTSFLIIKNYDFKNLVHLNIFFIFFSLYGIYEYFVNIYIGNFNFRLDSYMKEPSHLIIICIFMFLLNIYIRIKHTKIVTFLSIILILLSESFLGLFILLIVLFCLIFMNKFRFIYKSYVILLLFVLFYLMFTNLIPIFDEVVLRYNDLINFELKNLSISVLYVNFKVVIESFSIFGNGIGSHKFSFYENIQNIQLREGVLENYIYLNFDDAGSLLLRLVSDFGLFSLIIFYLIYSKVRYLNYNLILVSYIAYAFLRMGHYFPPEAFFIILMVFKLEYYKKGYKND